MFRKSFLTILLLVVIVSFSFGDESKQKFQVVYLDGELNVQKNGAWKSLSVGDELSSDSTIKLKSNTIVELSGNGSRIIVSKKGIYSIDKLIKKEKVFLLWKLTKIVRQNFRSLTGKAKRKSPGIMGVRGAEVGGSGSGESIGWADESSDLLEEGTELFKKGKYEKALEPLLEGLDSVGEDTEEKIKQELLFYTGYSYFLLGEKAQALKYLRRIRLDSDSEHLEELLLARGKLFLDSFDFEEALGSFQMYITNFPEGGGLQTAYYLAALSAESLATEYKETATKESATKETETSKSGDTSARIEYRKLRNRYLEKAYLTDPSSDIGRTAREMLQGK